jgi:ribonuclease HI
MKVIMYTDGAAKGNPGRGGYGTVLLYKDLRKELSEGYRLTTNNRMELLAVIRGLQALKKPGLDVEIYSDSQYVVNSVEKGWLKGWVLKGFKGKKNQDLWEEYLKASAPHRVRFRWVKGHAGNPENERCDQLAVQSAEGGHLLTDHGFESNVG